MHQHLIQPYVIRNYEITDHRITTPVTLVLISDTHESELDLDRLSHDLNTVHPDAVLICGDLIVSADIAFEHEKWLTNTIELLKTVALHYPTYVIDGNHEVRVESTVLWDGNTTKRCYDWLWNYIKGFGGHDLNNKKVDIKGIEVFGFKSDVEYYYRRYKKKITAELIEESIGKMPDKDKYSILLGKRYK